MDNIEGYLRSKGIDYVERRGELSAKCVFNGCDDDSRRDEYHLSFKKDTGQYHCFKCDEKGNLTTLKKFFGDEDEKPKQKKPANDRLCQTPEKEAAKRHNQLTTEVRAYLETERGINDSMIKYFQLGQTKQYSRTWITIPVKGFDGGVAFFKLRRWPADDEGIEKYRVYPGGSATLFNGNVLASKKPDEVMVVEGEFDVIIATQNKLPTTVSSTAGATTFKEEWLRHFEYTRTLWLCLDNDEKGRAGADKITLMFTERYPNCTIMQITLPKGVKDLTDYFSAGYAKEDLFTKYAAHIAGEDPIDPASIEEMTIEELADILNSTIKFDDANKCIVFLGMLTAYTESDQLNIYLTGPSSSGKTHIANEVSYYFPAEDVDPLAEVSPTAFKHQEQTIDPETGEKYVDCERKILLFTELPHHELQKNLRPLLSHDSKMIKSMTTDKNKSGSLGTKTVHIRGFAATIFCSTSNYMDEQERTRALLLSPDTTHEKIKVAKEMANERSADPKKFQAMIDADDKRRNLQDRIRYVKSLHIDTVIIPNKDKVLQMFDETSRRVLPRQPRDIVHLNSLIKAVALLNAHSRIDESGQVIANDADIEAAIELWRKINTSQELGVTPYIENFYRAYMLTPYNEKLLNNVNTQGISREEVKREYFNVHGTPLNDDGFRKDIIPALKVADIIDEVDDPNDKRKKLILPKIDVETPDGGDEFQDYGVTRDEYGQIMNGEYSPGGDGEG